MKLFRLKRFVILVLAYNMIFFSLFLFWGEITSSDIMLDFLLFPLSIILLAFFIILYKKKWINVPAKITFFSLFLINLILSVQYFFGYINLIYFLPSLLPLIFLYKNDLKEWFTSLKNKPFCIFKKSLEISKKDYLLIILAMLVILVPWVYAIFKYSFFYISWIVIIKLIVIFSYLLLKPSPLKSILRVGIFLWCIFLFYNIVQAFWYNGLYNIKYINESNGLVEGILIYVERLAFTVFAIFVIYNTRLKKVFKGTVAN